MEQRFPSERRTRDKFISVLLALIIPGTGHFYLGFMQRGLVIMVLLGLDIAAIPYFAIGRTNIPLVVLFSCLIPVIYLYNVFDALHMADVRNGDRRNPVEIQPSPFRENQTKRSGRKPGFSGMGLAVIGVLLIVFGTKPPWVERALHSYGSQIGAVLLIGAGVYLYWKENRRR